jgi:hypothetical protein
VKKSLIPLVLVAGFSLVVGLAGCAPAEVAVRTSPEETTSATAPETAVEVNVLDAVEASYQLWLSQGMTEEVTSSGDTYILTYEPRGDFVAALYNVELEDVIPIEQPELFTVYSAWMMLKDDATVIVEGENQLTLTNDGYGDFTVFMENGIIVSGEAVNGSWTGVFRYEPDLPTLKLLEQALNAEQ